MRRDGRDSLLKPLPFARIEEAPAACIKFYTRGETRGCPAPVLLARYRGYRQK